MNWFVSSLTELLARVIVLFTAITVHEFAHGYAAYKLGDPTAKYSGRLSLNPMSHLDPIGALCMVFFRFGWAKPVPINPMYFKDRKRDSAITAAAGPLANILLAFVTAIICSIYVRFFAVDITVAKFATPVTQQLFSNYASGFVYTVLEQLAILNISFAVFNLIPFPPLDGSKILGAFLSYENYGKLLQYERFGFPILMILSFSGILEKIMNLFIDPLFSLWLTLLNSLINILS